MTPWLDFNPEELRLFVAETEELLEQLETGLLALEQGERSPQILNDVFRAAHTIKGSSATLGLEGMARLTHALENRLDAWRSGQEVPSPDQLAPVLSAVDLLRTMLMAVADGNPPPDAPAQLLQQLTAAPGPGGPLEAPSLSQPPVGDGGTPADTTPAGAQPAPPGAADTARWLVTVHLDPSSPMPAARAFQLLLALEQVGTVVASDPSREAIEAEWQGHVVRLWMGGTASAEALRAAAAGVGDVTGVQVQAVASSAEPAPAPIPAAPSRTGEDRTIRVDVELLDRLLNLVGELVLERGRLARLGQELAHRSVAHELVDDLFRINVQLARITSALQDEVLRARMLPIARVFRRFPRLVRDLAQQLGKDVELQTEGEETELDRALLDAINDPLLHLVRNAVDHGIEPPEERRRLGKPPTGRVRLTATRSGNHVVVRLEDDGRGIDPERLRLAAVAKGWLTPERASTLGDREALELLFLPGFSTAEKVSDVSGRGVGLDVVRTKVEQAGGRVEITSRPGLGTTFTLSLPLTMATLRALLVRVGPTLCALPLGDVSEVVRVDPHEITSLQGRWVTTVRGQVVPLLWLRQFTEPRFRPSPPQGALLAALVEHQGHPVGLVVDGLLGEQEVVVKGLGQLLANVRGLSGATILGDGRLALILDVPSLVAVLGHGGAASAAGTAVATGAATPGLAGGPGPVTAP